MTETQQKITESLVTDLRNGTLTEAQLRRKIAAVATETDKKRQDILYLQAGTTSPASQVIGMTYIEAGVLKDAPSDPNEWQYQTVLNAVQDGCCLPCPTKKLTASDSNLFWNAGDKS